VVALARDLGIRRTCAIANKIACEADLDFVRAHLAATEILGVLPTDRDLELEARTGEIDRGRPFHREMLRIAGLLGE
jgi:CO dehydrogenase nickel-insertion accessory protein CooC1